MGTQQTHDQHSGRGLTMAAMVFTGLVFAWLGFPLVLGPPLAVLLSAGLSGVVLGVAGALLGDRWGMAVASAAVFVTLAGVVLF